MRFLHSQNRVKCFDEAFHSRISMALKYDALESPARAKIWKTFLSLSKEEGITDEDIKGLADLPLNGREIKSTIRLAQATAMAECVAHGKKPSNAQGLLRRSHLDAVLSVSQRFFEDLK